MRHRSIPTAALLTSALLLAAPVFASPRSPGQNRNGSAATAQESRSRSVTGTVLAYEPGKLLRIKTADNKVKTFNLSQEGLTSSIDPGVAVGSQVTATETHEGKTRTLTAVPAGQDEPKS